MGCNLTYHQPDMGMKLLNYGFNIDFLSNQYGDFFIWRSPTEVYKPLLSPTWAGKIIISISTRLSTT